MKQLPESCSISTHWIIIIVCFIQIQNLTLFNFLPLTLTGVYTLFYTLDTLFICWILYTDIFLKPLANIRIFLGIFLGISMEYLQKYSKVRRDPHRCMQLCNKESNWRKATFSFSYSWYWHNEDTIIKQVFINFFNRSYFSSSSSLLPPLGKES